MMKESGSTLRKEAKAMANDRRKRKEKHRQLRQWVYDMFRPNTAGRASQADLGDSDSDGSPDSPAHPWKKGRVWGLRAHNKGRPLPHGVTLDTMLQVAKNCYDLARHDFDKMDLYDHMYYIQAILKPGVPTGDTVVDRQLIVLAQQQLNLAKNNPEANIARLALFPCLPKEISANVKVCRNCYWRYLPSSAACTCNSGSPKPCPHGACFYHSGELRSYNDTLGQEGGNLGEDFLTRANVKLQEFKIWMGTFYWSCCGGKLQQLGPEVGKRSQRKKRQALADWEIANPYDGKVGCMAHGQRLGHHVPIEF
ncbi:hypothetical protein F5Y13DRAFT_192171 [Hypoxylon sp. FL1857]|nr:hypothetical protein F5Y13DRAFT_192171 [Hypoxylon sp. FL1857]